MSVFYVLALNLSCSLSILARRFIFDLPFELCLSLPKLFFFVPGKQTLASKQKINFFKGATSGLREERIDNGNVEQQSCENVVRFLVDGREHNRD